VNDNLNRELALNETESYIVQAPAGSGKTELLVQRYLKLLSISKNPENVIAMTFTKKAVNELTSRVIDSLMSTKLASPVEPHKKITFDLSCKVMDRSKKENWNILDMPERIKISTIDGLSSLITNRYPTQEQLVPRRIMEQSWERERAYREATEQTLLTINEPEYERVVGPVLLYLDNNVEKFYRLIIHMISKRDQWLTRLYRGDPLNPKKLKESASKIIIEHLSLLELEAKKHIGAGFFESLGNNMIEEYSKIKSMPGKTLNDLEGWRSISSLCLTKDEWRKTVNVRNGFHKDFKEQKARFVSILSDLRSKDLLKDLLYEVSTLPDIDIPKPQAEILDNISGVLKICVAQLKVIFDREQACDYIEIAMQADDALDDSASISDISLFLDYKINHVLIDEFQDTSYSQFSLIEKLINNWHNNSGKTLFIVGDPMQSIYRFRESQVGLFLKVKESGIANLRPKFLQLNTNFRSSKGVVDGNNEIFSKIFPKFENINKGAISYSYSDSESSVTSNSPIEIYPFSANQYQLEGQKVVEIINNEVNINPSTEVAVLVRNRSHLADIVTALKSQGVEYESLNTNPFRDHMFTRDLLSLTRSLLYLGDKLAWLSVLRAPWCGLLLEDLLVLSSNEDAIIIAQLNDTTILNKLTKDGQDRARHIAIIMNRVLANMGRFSFVELLMFALNKLIPDNYLNIQESMIKQKYLQIINDCEVQQSLTIKTIKSMLEELYAPSASAKVKLMTIHQAKGLEFDVVIIPGLGRRPKSDNAPLMNIKEFADSSLLLAPIKSYKEINESNTYSYLKHIDSQQDNFEIMRLLYVAMTRAKRNIYLLGCANRNNGTSSKSFLHLLMRFYQSKFDELEHQEEVIKSKKHEYLKLLRQSNLENIDESLDHHHEQIDYQMSLDNLYKSLLGTLIHKYLELEIFDLDKKKICSELIRIGVPQNKINESIEFVTRMLNNTKQDLIFSWLFKPRDSTLVEAEFVINGTNIVIDRLFVESNILWIIDYKTAQLVDGESISQFILRQQEQHTKQLLSYKNALGEIYNNEIKCALYCPGVQKLIEV